MGHSVAITNASCDYNIPSTRKTRSFVTKSTLRSGVSQVFSSTGTAAPWILATSSFKRCCNPWSLVSITNDSSVSRCADRELRFVDPNSEAYGCSASEGRSHMPTHVLAARWWELGWRTFGVIRPPWTLPFKELHTARAVPGSSCLLQSPPKPLFKQSVPCWNMARDPSRAVEPVGLSDEISV